MFFELQKQRNNVWGFILFWILKCSLTSPSILSAKNYFWTLAFYS
jgi:hypothetical protein